MSWVPPYRLRFIIPAIVCLFFVFTTMVFVHRSLKNAKDDAIASISSSLKTQLYRFQNNFNDLKELKREDLIKCRIAELCLDSKVKLFAVSDDNGVVIYSNFREFIDEPISTLGGFNLSRAENVLNTTSGKLFLADDDKFTGYYIVNLGLVSGELRRERTGLIYFTYDFSLQIEKARKDAIYSGLMFFVIGLFFAIMLSYVIYKIITSRVEKINSAMKLYAQGNKNVRLDFSGKDEIGLLANGFDSMVLEIEAKNSSLKLMRFIIEHSADAIYLIKPDGSFYYFNSAACKAIGFNEKELAKLNIFDIDQGINPALWVKKWEELRVQGNMIFESLYFTINHDVIPVEIRANYFNIDGKEYNCLIVRDITGRKKAEKELLEAKERAEESERNLILKNEEYMAINEELNERNKEYAALNEEYVSQNEELQKAFNRMEESEANLLDAQLISQIGNFYLDIENGEILWSMVCYSIFDIDDRTDSPQIKYELEKRIDTEDFKIISQKFEEALLKKNSFSFELKILVKENIKHILMIAIPVIDDNNNSLVAYKGTLQDITERKSLETAIVKAKEKAEQSDHLKTAFLQNMSHEIRTPMNAIMGFSELLKQNFHNKEKLNHFSGIINQRARDLLDIINDILDIAKIESGQLAINNEECNIKELFDELKIFFIEQKVKTKKENIEFEVHLNSALNIENLITDKGKLKQILINLINNAFKFTSEGRIEAGCTLNEEKELVFYVSDTGLGISAEDHQHIFERFYQVDSGTARIFGGTGLGLPIVKGLVEVLGGNVWLQSEPGKGSTFFFTINVKNSYNAAPVIPEKQALASKQLLHDKTILVVEDDYYNTALIDEILSVLGANVINAETGKEAIDIALSKHPDLILMDIGLTDMTGYEAIRQILVEKPSMKIVAQTAYAAPDDKRKAMNNGCIDYISKPLKAQNLVDVVGKYL